MDGDPPTVQVDELLDLLADEYACALLCALDEGPMAASDLVETCEMTRPTVYRRLDRLTDAGLVRSRMTPARDGHHRKEFYLVLDGAEFQVCPDGIDGAIRTDSPVEY